MKNLELNQMENVQAGMTRHECYVNTLAVILKHYIMFGAASASLVAGAYVNECNKLS